MRSAASAASSGESTSSSAGTGIPCRANSALDSASESVGIARSAGPLDVGLDRLAALVEPALAPGVADHGVEIGVPPVGNLAGRQAAHGVDLDQRVAGREEPSDVNGQGGAQR